MIFERTIRWYISFITQPFFVAAAILLLIEASYRIPSMTWFSLTLATPLSWLVRLGGAGYVGYSIGRDTKHVYAAATGGALFGIPMGILYFIFSALRRLTLAGPNFYGIFGGFDVFFAVISEAIICAFFAAVGAVLAGAQLRSIEDAS